MLKEKQKIGALILVILVLSGIAIITWPEQKVKMRIDSDKSTFYLLENGRWKVAGREYNSLWDFPRKLNRDLSQTKVSTEYDLEKNTTTITRITKYFKGPVIKDIYFFNGSVKDVELFPISHKIIILNATGYTYQYEIRDLRYDGLTKEITSPFSVGKMTVRFDEGYYFAKAYKSGLIKVRYKITNDTVILNNRLFDPPATVSITYYYDDAITSTQQSFTGNQDLEANNQITINASVSPNTLQVCINSTNPDITYTCGTGNAVLNWNITAGERINEISISQLTGLGTLYQVRNNSLLKRTTLTIEGNPSETYQTVDSYNMDGTNPANLFDQDYSTYGTPTNTQNNDFFMNYTLSDYENKYYFNYAGMGGEGSTYYFYCKNKDDEWINFATHVANVNYNETTKIPHSCILTSPLQIKGHWNDSGGLTQYNVYEFAVLKIEYPEDLTVNIYNDDESTLFNGMFINRTYEVRKDSQDRYNITKSFNDSGTLSFNIELNPDFNVSNATITINGESNGYIEQNYIQQMSDTSGNEYTPYAPKCVYHDNYMWCMAGSCIGSICDGEYNTTLRITPGKGLQGAYKRRQTPYNAGVGSCAVKAGNYIYLIGGFDNTNYYSNVYRYYPTTNSWTAMTSLPIPKGFHSCALNKEKNLIFVAGGYTTGGSYSKKAYYYNISSNTWTTINDLPDYQESGWMEELDENHMITFGGTRLGSLATGGRSYIYDISTGTWSTTGSLPDSVFANSGVNINGEIYSIGGYDGGTSSYTPNIYKYDSEAGTWSTITDDLTYHLYYDYCDEVENHTICIGSGGYGYGYYEREIYFFPYSVNLQIGNNQNLSWNYNTDLTNEQEITNISNDINNALNNCNPSSRGLCNVSFYFSNQGAGKINIYDLRIYQDVNPITETKQKNVTCFTSDCDVEIYVSGTNKDINVKDIEAVWLGTKSINITASTEGDATYTAASTTNTMTIYYSKYEKTLPYTWTDAIFFTPYSYNQTGVEAFGQTSNKPLLNITGKNQDKSFYLYARLNESLACLTFKYNTAYDYSTANQLTTTYQSIGTFNTFDNNQYWLWVDLNNCNATANRYLRPELQLSSCCTTCEACPTR